MGSASSKNRDSGKNTSTGLTNVAKYQASYKADVKGQSKRTRKNIKGNFINMKNIDRISFLIKLLIG